MRQIAEVVLEGCESGDDLVVQAESGAAIGNPLFCLRNDAENRLTQVLQRGSLGLLEPGEVFVNLLPRHPPHHGVTAAEGSTVASGIERLDFTPSQTTI